MAEIRVFVYGTLRPGDYNANRFGLKEENVVQGARAPGALYHVSNRSGVYPCAKFDEEGEIIGDVLTFDSETDSRLVESIDRMEIGAGYRVEQVPVFLPDGTEIKCQAYHYERTPEGPRIESGDWFAADGGMWNH